MYIRCQKVGTTPQPPLLHACSVINVLVLMANRRNPWVFITLHTCRVSNGFRNGRGNWIKNRIEHPTCYVPATKTFIDYSSER